MRHLVVACLVTALLGGTVTAYASHTFPDVPDSNPFHNQISWMAGTGITGGFADGTFRPNDNVTRGQRAAFMQRLYNLQAGLKAVTVGSGGEAGGTSGAIDTWVNVPGATATVVVPPGTQGRVLTQFTSEAQCNFGDNIFVVVFVIRPQCMARILVNGSPAAPDGFVVDNSLDAVDPDVAINSHSFSIQAATAANRNPGTYNVTVQVMANDADANADDKLLISLQDWILTAEVILSDA